MEMFRGVRRGLSHSIHAGVNTVTGLGCRLTYLGRRPSTGNSQEEEPSNSESGSSNGLVANGIDQDYDLIGRDEFPRPPSIDPDNEVPDECIGPSRARRPSIPIFVAPIGTPTLDPRDRASCFCLYPVWDPANPLPKAIRSKIRCHRGRLLGCPAGHVVHNVCWLNFFYDNDPALPMVCPKPSCRTNLSTQEDRGLGKLLEGPPTDMALVDEGLLAMASRDYRKQVQKEVDAVKSARWAEIRGW